MKKIGIFGLGKTGISAYEYLKRDNDRHCEEDSNPTSQSSNIICYDDNEQNRKEFEDKFGSGALKNIDDPAWTCLDYIILSPGVPLHFPAPHDIVKLARANNIPLTSDIELLYQANSEAKYIAITGTNGKSTTTALIAHILGPLFAVGGNIGVPVLDLPKSEGYVLELSSYQLDLLESFHANIAVLLNITPDHIDRHGSLENYIEAKKRIWRNMGPKDHLIIGVDNNITRKVYEEIKGKVPFALVPTSIKDEVGDLPFNPYLLGDHNRENMLVAIAAAKIIGLPDSAIKAKIADFVGLKHRMQFVRHYKNIAFYNDSKATNAEAASKSIAALDNIYLIAGGVPKEGGIESLNHLFCRIKKTYLFGEAKNLFARTLEGKVEYEVAEDMKSAILLAYRDALASGKSANILLAPACASFDQFKNFEHRGDEFIRIVNSIDA